MKIICRLPLAEIKSQTIKNTRLFSRYQKIAILSIFGGECLMHVHRLGYIIPTILILIHNYIYSTAGTRRATAQ